MPNTTNSENTGTLYARVSYADQALPLANAVVRIYGAGEKTPRFTLLTNSAGLTEQVPLQTLPASDSQVPGGTPFTLYNATVEAPGYYRLTVENIPIFSGILSVLPVAMIPLSAYDSADVYPEGQIDLVKKDPQELAEVNA